MNTRVSPDPDRRLGYLNENLKLQIGRIGGDLSLGVTLEVIQPGHALGLCPADDPADIDDFQPNDAVQARFSRPNDAAYQFHGRVLEVDGRTPLLWVSAPVHIERIQARRHVRVSAPLAGEVAVAGPRRLAGTHHGFRSVPIVDLSAGGLAIRSEAVFEEGTVMIVEAPVPDRRGVVHLHARAKVVRSAIDSGPAEPTCYRYGLEYIDLGSKQEAQLVASVFWQMSRARDGATGVVDAVELSRGV